MLIRETARRIARHRWTERRLFEIVGGWAADDVELAPISHHHAWRATQWDVLAPVLHDLDPAELEVGAGVVAAYDALAASSDAVERLAGLVHVALPDVIAGYERHLAGTTSVADGPAQRVLRLVLVDAQDDWRAALVQLRSHLRTEDDVVRAAAHQSALARLLLTAEG